MVTGIVWGWFIPGKCSIAELCSKLLLYKLLKLSPVFAAESKKFPKLKSKEFLSTGLQGAATLASFSPGLALFHRLKSEQVPPPSMNIVLILFVVVDVALC